MPPAAAAAAGRLATYVLTPSVAVPLVRLPRRCGRARRFDSASYGSPLVSLGLATVSFFNNLLDHEAAHQPPIGRQHRVGQLGDDGAVEAFEAEVADEEADVVAGGATQGGDGAARRDELGQ